MRRAIECAAALFVLVSLVGLACDPIQTICATVTRCADGAPLVGVHFVVRQDGDEVMSGYTEPDGKICSSTVGSAGKGADLAYDKPGYNPEHRKLEKDDSEVDVPSLCMTADAGTDGG